MVSVQLSCSKGSSRRHGRIVWRARTKTASTPASTTPPLPPPPPGPGGAAGTDGPAVSPDATRRQSGGTRPRQRRQGPSGCSSMAETASYSSMAETARSKASASVARGPTRGGPGPRPVPPCSAAPQRPGGAWRGGCRGPSAGRPGRGGAQHKTAVVVGEAAAAALVVGEVVVGKATAAVLVGKQR